MTKTRWMLAAAASTLMGQAAFAQTTTTPPSTAPASASNTMAQPDASAAPAAPSMGAAFTPITPAPGADIDNWFPQPDTRENNWGQDREAMRNGTSFAGFPKTWLLTEDTVIEISMGVIVDRTKEVLCRGDLAIVRMRSLLIRAARDYAAGRQPFGTDALDGRQLLQHDLPVQRRAGKHRLHVLVRRQDGRLLLPQVQGQVRHHDGFGQGEEGRRDEVTGQR